MAPLDILLIAAAIQLAAPLLLAGVGELLSERAGVINIGLEGMILVGAFFGFLAAYATGSVWIGVVAAIAAGTILAALMAVLCVELGADQIVVGVGLTVLASGITIFLSRVAFAGHAEVIIRRMSPFHIPGLSGLPGIGRLFDQLPLVYLAYLLVPVVGFLLYRTRWGLAIRACGEAPEAADSAGISVRLVRWLTVLSAGGLAGCAGALLSVGQLGLFVEGMSSGRGFLAIAAVIFGRWRPLGVLAGCLVFGGADALQLRLQSLPTVPRSIWVAAVIVVLVTSILAGYRRRPGPAVILLAVVTIAAGAAAAVFQPRFTLPSQLWLALPYVLTLVALAGVVGRARTPAALATAFRRGG